MARVDYTDRASAYRRVRTLPDDVLAVWDGAITQAGLTPARRALDIGAGPGGFLDRLAQWSAASVVAVEPSRSMREEAAATGSTDRYPYVTARAERLPFAAGSADWAWLSTVVHQFDDLTTAAGELWRVLRPGGHVLVRGFLSDVEVTGLFALFPGIERSAASFPSTEAVVSAFERAGFAFRSLQDVIEPWRFDATSWAQRVRSVRDTDSALRPLTDAEIEGGIRAVLDRHGDRDRPLASDGTLRLVVFDR